MNFWSERFTEGFLCFSFEQKLNFLCLFGDVVPQQHIFARTVCTQNLCVLYLLFIKVLQAILWSKCVTWQCFYTLKTLRYLLLMLCDETLLLAALWIPQNPLLHVFDQPISPGCPQPKKTANFLGCNHWFPYKMVSEKPVQKPGQ